MASLADCFKIHNVSTEKQVVIRALVSGHKAAGKKNPQISAMKEMIRGAESDRAEIVRLIEDKGGVVAPTDYQPFDEQGIEPSEKNELVTDASDVRKVKNSIAEGEMILVSGKNGTGESMSPDEYNAVLKSVNKSKEKVGEKVPETGDVIVTRKDGSPYKTLRSLQAGARHNGIRKETFVIIGKDGGFVGVAIGKEKETASKEGWNDDTLTKGQIVELDKLRNGLSDAGIKMRVFRLPGIQKDRYVFVNSGKNKTIFMDKTGKAAQVTTALQKHMDVESALNGGKNTIEHLEDIAKQENRVKKTKEESRAFQEKQQKEKEGQYKTKGQPSAPLYSYHNGEWGTFKGKEFKKANGRKKNSLNSAEIEEEFQRGRLEKTTVKKEAVNKETKKKELKAKDPSESDRQKIDKMIERNPHLD